MVAKDDNTTSDDTDRIEQALDELPARTRTIFLLLRLDGLSYAEIAEQCGTSVQRVERHITKAMLHLDRALDGQRPWWWRWFGRWW